MKPLPIDATVPSEIFLYSSDKPNTWFTGAKISVRLFQQRPHRLMGINRSVIPLHTRIYRIGRMTRK